MRNKSVRNNALELAASNRSRICTGKSQRSDTTNLSSCRWEHACCLTDAAHCAVAITYAWINAIGGQTRPQRDDLLQRDGSALVN